MDEQFRQLLIAACARPAMYVGRCSLWDLSHYFAGYCHAADDAKSPCGFKQRFQRWIESRFGIFSSGWHWVRILQHVYGGDESAIANLPRLYDEFRTQTDGMTDSELWCMMETRMVEMRGGKHWCPDSADTWTKLMPSS